MNRTVAGGGTVVAASAHVTYAAAREGAARGGGVRLPGRRGAHLAYGVANARLGMLTRQVAQEAGQAGVRIDCIAPSAIGTHECGPNRPAEVQDQVAALHPPRRMRTSGDVAQPRRSSPPRPPRG